MSFPQLRHELTLLAAAAAFAPAIGAADPGEPGAAPPTLYEWTTEAGGVHYTPDPSRIPASRLHTQRRIDPDSDRSGPPPPSPLAGPDEPSDAPRLSKPSARPVSSASAATSAGTETTGRDALDPSSREGGWAVQLLATPLRHEFPPLPEVALRAGEHFYRTTATVDGEPWTRLRVGLFRTRAGAQAALERLAPEFPEAWLLWEEPADALPPVSAGSRKDPSPGPSRSEPSAPRYAIQLRAIPASEDPGELPALEPPAGSRLYWTRVDLNQQAWQRLRLGDFATLAAARVALALVADEFPGAWIATVRGSRDRPEQETVVSSP